jgi:hypothetical protein
LLESEEDAESVFMCFVVNHAAGWGTEGETPMNCKSSTAIIVHFNGYCSPIFSLSLDGNCMQSKSTSALNSLPPHVNETATCSPLENILNLLFFIDSHPKNKRRLSKNFQLFSMQIAVKL